MIKLMLFSVKNITFHNDYLFNFNFFFFDNILSNIIQSYEVNDKNVTSEYIVIINM